MAINEVDISNEKKEKLEKLDSLLADAKENNDNLIDVLHKTQNIFGYLSRDIQIRVAEGLGVPLSEVYSVVSFYSLFTVTPRGRHVIDVCMGTACYVKGSKDIMDKLTSDLDIEPGQTTEDKRFTLAGTRSVGACGMAPVIIIDGDMHGRIKPDDLPEILEKYE